MNKKRCFGNSAFTVFMFLFSGDIIYLPFYKSGKPLMGYVISWVILFVIIRLLQRCVFTEKAVYDKKYSAVIAVDVMLLTVVLSSYAVASYAKSLGSFAKYYASAFVLLFAVVASVVSAGFLAYKGITAVKSFAHLVSGISAVCILSGAFGFIYTKNIAPVSTPLHGVGDISFGSFATDILLIAADIALLMAVLYNKTDAEEKAKLDKQVLCGAVVYVMISTMNILKNILLFGSDFIRSLDNPNLAAIRLIPMFEFPEISVPVNTFALTVRLSVYMCAVFFMLKDSFGEKYKSYVAVPANLALTFAASILAVYMANGESTRLMGALCAVLASVLCVIFYKTGKIRRNGDGL